MEIVYEYGTIVRIKQTGQSAQITRVCWCGGHDGPLHYEAWVSDNKEKNRSTLGIFFQREIELECLPYEPSPQEIKESIDTLAEIIVNHLLEKFKEN